MSSTKTISIILTESCNLNCTYCYEKYKNPRNMNAEKAIELIEEELNKEDGYNFASIHLFGGEPFLVFPTLKKIVEHLKQHEYKKRYQLFTTTNGTLVHGKIQEWLKDNKKFLICGLSLDGTRDVHNKNRSNSFDNIDLSFFKETYPRQQIKMTISENTLPQLAESIIFCHDYGFLVGCNLAYNIDWSNEENEKLLERELTKLIEYYLNNPNIEPCSLFNYKLENVAVYENKEYITKWCGAGVHTCAYTADGNKYPCQFFTPLSIGNDSKKLIESLKFETNISTDLLDDKCRACVIKSICPTCYGANYVSTGNLYKKDDNYCKLTKIIVKAVSYYKAKMWELKRLKLTDKQEYTLLKSIRIIQEDLN